MKRGLMLSLVVVMAALLGMASVYASAPEIIPIPDIIVGDEEGNATGDLNIFEFVNALDLANQVMDDNTAPAEILWSFDESDGVDPTTDYSINGNFSGEANITGVGNPVVDTTVSIINESLSPGGTAGHGYPFADPATAESHVRAITFYASDLDKEDSQTIEIKSLDGEFDGFSVVETEESVFDFETGAQGWVYLTIPAVFGSPTTTTTGGKLKITASTASQIYGSYSSDIDGIIYDSDANLYRATWNVTTSGQSTLTSQPGMRTMFNTAAYVDNAEQLLYPDANVGGGIPVNSTFTYQQYFAVSDLSSMVGKLAVTATTPSVVTKDLGGIYLSFELVNIFGGTGAVALEEVTIDKLSAAPGGTNVYTYDADFADWSVVVSAPSVFLAATTTNTGGSVTLTSGMTPTAGTGYYGGRRTALPAPSLEAGPERVTMNAGSFYRARFMLSSASSTPTELATVPSFRMRLFSQDERQSIVRQLIGYAVVNGTGGTFTGAQPEVAFATHMPSLSGSYYDVYFSPVTDLPANADGLGLAIEITDFSNTQGGTIELTKVLIDQIPVPAP